MSQLPESNLSDEDKLLVVANNLGSPLAVYRLRPGYIRFLYRMSWLIILIGMGILATSIIWFFHGLREFQFTLFLSSLLAGLLGLSGGIICLRVVALQAQQEHTIVCERGLLRIVGSTCIDVVHWMEVRSIEKGLFNQLISIIYNIPAFPGVKSLHISSFYQDFDMLIVLIRQHLL
jgi:hypothetical protein